MTKELIESKIAELKAQLTQLQANAHAVGGAIQFAEHLLLEFDKPEQEPEKV